MKQSMFFILCSFVEALKAFLFVMIPVLLGCFIDNLIQKKSPWESLLILITIAGINLFLQIISDYAFQKYGRFQERILREKMLQHLCNLPLLKIDNYGNGELMLKFFRDADAYGRYLSDFTPQFFAAFFSIAVAIIVAICKNSMIACLYILLLPLLLLLLYPYKNIFSRLNHAIRTLYDRTMNSLFEFAHILPFLRSINAESPYILTASKKFDHIRNIHWLNDRGTISFKALNKIILYTGEYGILAIAGYYAWQNKIKIGDVVVFQVLFLSILNALTGIFQLLPSWEEIKESKKSLNELFSIPKTDNSPNAIPLTNKIKSIELRNVSFYYTKEREIFTNYNCKITKGMVVALAGENGTGKTTLLRLFTGYLQPQKGNVYINDQLISHWKLETFRNKIAAVFQDSLLISGTLRDNITLKNKKYTAADIEFALKQSGADSLIKRLPNGIYHKIGSDGSGLSGGERQKIAIARALIRKPEILIFDEVTNHLDYDSRLKMRNLIISLRGHVTIFMVSHDPELLALCDKQIIIQHGE